MPSSRDERLLKTIRGREEYAELIKYIDAKRPKLEDPMAPEGTQLVNDIFVQIDQLFDQNISGKVNTSLINADQTAFKGFVETITQRMKNQARNVPGEITLEAFVSAVADFEPHRSRSDALSKLGLWFNRASNSISLPAFMPTLNEVNPATKRAPSRPRGRRPTGIPEEAGSADGSEFQTQKLQERLQGLICYAVTNYEELHNYEPVQLHRLCFDKTSFIYTLENLFITGALLRTQLLWLGASKGMLPVVGTVENRGNYLQKFVQEDGAEPTGYSGPNFRAHLSPQAKVRATELKQFNLNLTYELFEELQRCFGSEETLIDRNQLDTFDLEDRLSECSSDGN